MTAKVIASTTLKKDIKKELDYNISCHQALGYMQRYDYFMQSKKKIAIFVKKKMLTKMVALLCILLFILAITGIICLIGKINGWHSPIADKM